MGEPLEAIGKWISRKVGFDHAYYRRGFFMEKISTKQRWMIELEREIDRVEYGEILLVVRKGRPTKFKTTTYQNLTQEEK